MKVELAPEALAPLRKSINNFLGLKSAGDLLNTGAYPKLEQLETAATIWDQLHDSICVSGGGSYLDPKREDVAVIVVGDAPTAPISTMFAFRSHWTVFCIGQAKPDGAVDRLYSVVYTDVSRWRLRNNNFKDVVVVVMGSKDRAQAIATVANGVQPWVVAVAKGDRKMIGSTGFQNRWDRIKLLDAAPSPFWWADIDLTVDLMTETLHMAIWEPSANVQWVRAPGVPRVSEPPARNTQDIASLLKTKESTQSSTPIQSSRLIEMLESRNGHELPPPCDHKGCHEAYATQQRWLKRQAEAKPTRPEGESDVTDRRWETSGKNKAAYERMAKDAMLRPNAPAPVAYGGKRMSHADETWKALQNIASTTGRIFQDPILEINLSRFPAGTTPQDIMAAAATPEFQRIAREELNAQVRRQRGLDRA